MVYYYDKLRARIEYIRVISKRLYVTNIEF